MAGTFPTTWSDTTGRPVYRIEVGPDGGLYPLPYMALQADGGAWEEECATPGAPGAQAQHGSFANGSPGFPVIDRLSVGHDGTVGLYQIAAGMASQRCGLSSPAWDDAPLWRVLAGQADAIVGGDDAVLVIDDTALPKKGTHSVGAAPQYCGQLGKQANCQSLVSLTLTLARGEVPVPVGLRLFLPKPWIDDPARCDAAGVPQTARTAQAKPEIALDETDRVRAAGVRFGGVLADAGYGMSAPFRQGLSARGLVWSVGGPRTLTVFTTGVGLLFPRAGRAKPRKHSVPSVSGR